MTAKTQEIVAVTVGCRECDIAGGYYPSIREVPEYGAYVSECFNSTYNVDPYLDEDVDEDFVLVEKENDVCGIGEILQWVGLIESE